MQHTKDMYDDCGTIKSIESNGMGSFVYEHGSIKETLQVAEKCKVGDRVVKLVGKARPFFVITQDEWKSMPATEKESKTIKAKENTPQLGDILKRLDAAEANNSAANETIALLQAQLAKKNEATGANSDGVKQ